MEYKLLAILFCLILILSTKSSLVDALQNEDPDSNVNSNDENEGEKNAFGMPLILAGIGVGEVACEIRCSEGRGGRFCNLCRAAGFV